MTIISRVPAWFLSAFLHLLIFVLILKTLFFSTQNQTPSVEMIIVDAPQKASSAVKKMPDINKKQKKSEKILSEDKSSTAVIEEQSPNETMKNTHESLPVASEDYLVTAMPILETNIVVPYPEEAKKQGIQGSVILDLLIDSTGMVRKVDLVDSPHPSLSEPALKAVWKFKFKPGHINDKAVTVKIRYSYKFVIRG